MVGREEIGEQVIETFLWASKTESLKMRFVRGLMKDFIYMDRTPAAPRVARSDSSDLSAGRVAETPSPRTDYTGAGANSETARTNAMPHR